MNKQNNIVHTTGLEELILKIVSEQPGLKGREIAKIINSDKGSVNSILYGVLKNKCEQAENYGWYLSKKAPLSQKIDKQTLPKTALSNLSSYYLSCLSHDDQGGFSVFAESKFELDYVELKELPLEQTDDVFNSSEAQKLFGKMRKDRSRLEMFLGYPTSLKKVK
jgi:hypothetical protein